LAYPVIDHHQPVIQPRPKRKKIKLPIKNIVTAAIFLALVIWSGDLIANYIASRGTAPLPISEQPGVAQPPPVTEKVSDKLVLKIVARQNCWLQIKADEQVQFTATIPAGTTRVFEAARSISVKAGNAGGIDLFLNDVALPPLGDVGQVAEKQFDISSISKE